MFINLTPHDLHIVDENGQTRTIPRTGILARVSTTRKQVGNIDGIKIFKAEYGELEITGGSVQHGHGDVLIVSSVTLEKAKEYFAGAIVCAPSDLLRDAGGNIIGCNGLNLA